MNEQTMNKIERIEKKYGKDFSYGSGEFEDIIEKDQTMNEIEKILDKPEIHVMTDFDHAKLKEELSNLIAKKEREALFGYIAYLENLKNREIAVKSLSGLPDKRIKIPMLFGWYRDRAKDYLVSEYRAEYGRANPHDTPEVTTASTGDNFLHVDWKDMYKEEIKQIRKEAIEGFYTELRKHCRISNDGDGLEPETVLRRYLSSQEEHDN